MPVVWTPEIPGVADPLSMLDRWPAFFDVDDETHGAAYPNRVHVCGPCSSVLDVATCLAGQGALAVWDSVLAPRQWAGRGQMRRTWVSEPGNLFAAWRLPPVPLEWQGILSVLVGWSIRAGLDEMGEKVELKWPNDLLLHGRKVGGILIEERGDVLLAGVGLNLTSCPDDAALRSDHACPAGTLVRLLDRRSVFGLWLRLVHFGRLRYNLTLSASTPLEFSLSIEPLLAYLGTAVRIEDNRSSVRGVFAGIRADGGLVLHTDGGTRTFHSGSLTPEE